jgi:electron transfer flavoprotein alpha/beta subunit
MYAPAEPVAVVPAPDHTAAEVLERALAHGDEHVIKLTDTALDVGDERALAAALRAVELTEPLVPN